MEHTRREQLQDVGVAALVAVLGLVEVWLPMESVYGSGSPVVSSVGIVAFAVLLSQRRIRPRLALAALAVWPVFGVLTGGSLQVLFLGQLVPMLVLVYSLARHAPGRLRWLTAIAMAVLLVVADLFLPLLRDPGELVFHWGAVTLAYLCGHGLRASADRAAAAAVRAHQAETEARERAAAAVAEERARIARELHDIVAHAVGVIVVQAGAAEQVVEEDPAFARRALAAIRSTGAGALTEMRRMVHMLRELEPVGAFTPQPGVDALPELVGAVRESGLEVDVEVTGERTPLAAGLDLTAYRIVQEALTNVRRHSVAERARVALHFGEADLRIRVSDGGPARAAEGEPGHGIVGMRERAALFGGTLTVTSAPGFTVDAVLPLEVA
ncbi:sensor histidine kinase [Georgenia yuyongxinii]|uniref:histidine kinase n=1 Tax=Georgenia yuyongxinii TaxID=2589797 RepID=A0A552WU62_9MICO|nr:histidine kinase [Georgenia yuyongxinii]TRW46099.1 histidine kinase [Georgenia yuyongxinii]